MATSGSTDWSLTGTQVITGALRKLGVLPSGGAPSTAQSNDALEALNALVKAFHADGMPLWKITSTSFTVVSGTNTYTIGVGQTINVPAPLKLYQSHYTPSNGIAIRQQIKDRYDFNNLSTIASGYPVAIYYQPLGATGVIKLWPTPNDSTTQITLQYQTPFEDMDAVGNNFDFPAYWMQALIYNLAWSLAPEYGIPPTDRNILAQEARYWKQEALSYGSEEDSVYFQPEVGWK